MKLLHLDKVLFLDVDGVLNIMGAAYNSHGYDNIGNDPIEPHLMRRLEFIMERIPELKIVISSAWFESQLKRKLAKQRFKYLDRIIGATPRSKRWRGDQIKQWLDSNEIELDNYIVIDDEVDDICGGRCSAIDVTDVIHVDMNEGLSNKDATDIIIKLNDLSKYHLTEYLATMENIGIFTRLGYRAQVNIDEVTEENNPFVSFKIDNRYLSISLVRKEVEDGE